MFRVSQHPSSGVLKTVTAASGTGHNIDTATSLQRGQIGLIGLQGAGQTLARLWAMSCTRGHANPDTHALSRTKPTYNKTPILGFRGAA